MVPNWKITGEYDSRRDVWNVTVWLDEQRIPGAANWRPVAHVEQESLYPRFTPEQRIRMILRNLGTNPYRLLTPGVLEAWRNEQFPPSSTMVYPGDELPLTGL